MNKLATAALLAVLALGLAACAPMTPAPTGTSWPEPPKPAAKPKAAEKPAPAPKPVPEPQPSAAVSALLNQGWKFYRQDNFQGALSSAERAQRIDPRSPEVYLLMASAQFSLYQLAVAEQLARKGLALTQTGTSVNRQLQGLLARIAASR